MKRTPKQTIYVRLDPEVRQMLSEKRLRRMIRITLAEMLEEVFINLAAEETGVDRG